MKTMPDPSLWSRDMIADALGPLGQANKLWDAQCFTKPTKARAAEIDALLVQAADQIGRIRAELGRA